jgi:hypothetical protein
MIASFIEVSGGQNAMTRRAKVFVGIALVFVLAALPIAAAPKEDVGSAKLQWLIKKAHQVIEQVKDSYQPPPPPAPPADGDMCYC